MSPPKSTPSSVPPILYPPLFKITYQLQLMLKIFLYAVHPAGWGPSLRNHTFLAWEGQIVHAIGTCKLCLAGTLAATSA